MRQNSIIDTERLIHEGTPAKDKSLAETQMILNHKDAIEFLVDSSAEEIAFRRHIILNLHALLSNNLLPDPSAPGRLRQFAVGITNSVFTPLAIPQLIAEFFDLILDKANLIENPFEQAFFVSVHLPYLQPFDDVNKRVSRLAANIPMNRHNLAPLTFIDVPEEYYVMHNPVIFLCAHETGLFEISLPLPYQIINKMTLQKNIITIQHPESIHHTNGMIGSWTDWELTEKGIEQAENIACNLQLETKNNAFSLFVSPLKRAKQTAEIIGKKLDIQSRITEALKERSLGKANGKSVKWLKENIENEEKTIYDKCFGDAESRYDVWQRLLPFYQEIISNDEKNIIIVSHGDTLSLFNAMWLDLEAEILNRIDLYGVSGGVSFLHQTSTGKRIIKRLSDTSYIKCW